MEIDDLMFENVEKHVSGIETILSTLVYTEDEDYSNILAGAIMYNDMFFTEYHYITLCDDMHGLILTYYDSLFNRYKKWKLQ